MMCAFFIVAWSCVLLIGQVMFRFQWDPVSLAFNFLLILVIYSAFTFPFFSGFIGIIIASFIFEALSHVPHGYFLLVNTILYLSIQLLVDRLYTEAYVTKAFWVLPFSFTGQILGIVLILSPHLWFMEARVWSDLIFQTFFDAVVSFPLFIMLDFTLEKWLALFSRRRTHLTGADLYQVQNSQRKYY